VSGEEIDVSWDLSVTSDEDSTRNRWHIHRIGTSIEDLGSKPQCIDVLLANAIGDLEEDVLCNDESGNKRVLVQIQNVDSGGYLGYTSFLGVYHSRISEPQYTSFVLENVGRNSYVFGRNDIVTFTCIPSLQHTHFFFFHFTIYIYVSTQSNQFHALSKQRRDTQVCST